MNTREWVLQIANNPLLLRLAMLALLVAVLVAMHSGAGLLRRARQLIRRLYVFLMRRRSILSPF